YTVSNADEEVELLLQVVLRGLDPRVLHDVEAAGLRPAPDGEPDLVAPRHGERAPRVPGPGHQAFEAMRVVIAQVPHEAIQACLGLEGVRRLLAAAREPAHQRVARVEEVECRLLLGLLLHVEVHGRAVRRVGPERSEEHTSELQSRFDLVCRLLLEKKKIPAESAPPICPDAGHQYSYESAGAWIAVPPDTTNVAV